MVWLIISSPKLLFCHSVFWGLDSSMPGWKVFLFCLGFFSPLLGQILSLINLLFNDTYKGFLAFFFFISLGEKVSFVHVPMLDLWMYLRGELLCALQVFCVTIVPVFLELVKGYYSHKYLGFSYSLRQSNLKNVFFSSLCKNTACLSIYISVVCICDIMQKPGFFPWTGGVWGRKCALRGVSSFLTFVSNSILPK